MEKLGKLSLSLEIGSLLDLGRIFFDKVNLYLEILLEYN